MHKFVRDVYAVSSIVLLQLHLFLFLEGDDEMVRVKLRAIKAVNCHGDAAGVRILKHHAGVLVGTATHSCSGGTWPSMEMRLIIALSEALDMENVLL